MNEFLRVVIWYNYVALGLLALVMPFWGVALGATIVFIGDIYVVIESLVLYKQKQSRDKALYKSIMSIDFTKTAKTTIKDTLEQQHEKV